MVLIRSSIFKLSTNKHLFFGAKALLVMLLCCLLTSIWPCGLIRHNYKRQTYGFLIFIHYHQGQPSQTLRLFYTACASEWFLLEHLPHSHFHVSKSVERGIALCLINSIYQVPAFAFQTTSIGLGIHISLLAYIVSVSILIRLPLPIFQFYPKDDCCYSFALRGSRNMKTGALFSSDRCQQLVYALPEARG